MVVFVLEKGNSENHFDNDIKRSKTREDETSKR